jgi:hypothetical protein
MQTLLPSGNKIKSMSNSLHQRRATHNPLLHRKRKDGELVLSPRKENQVATDSR